MDTQRAHCAEHGDYESMAFRFGDRTIGWSHCPTCERLAMEKEATHRWIAEKSERQRRAEALLKRAGIPLRFLDRTLQSFVTASAEQRAALAVATDFAESFSDQMRAGASLIFSGKPGTGKSHLAIGIAKYALGLGYTVMYLNALDAIRMVRATWRKSSETTEDQVMSTLASIDLLVMDEVGMQYGTEGEQVILFDIINRRYQGQMPTILLTNQGAAGLKDYLGERAFDRLREDGRWIPFDWESFRGRNR